MILYKLSLPDWTKEYPTEEDLKKELYTHICYSCRLGCVSNGNTIWKAVNENSSIPDLLATGCGCEYDVGNGEDRVTHYTVSTNGVLI